MTAGNMASADRAGNGGILRLGWQGWQVERRLVIKGGKLRDGYQGWQGEMGLARVTSGDGVGKDSKR